jgi:hypothetical protein
MATLDEIVTGLIEFRNTTYTKLNALQADIDDLTDPTKKIKIWVDCFKCHGDGLVLDTGGSGLDPLDTGANFPPGGVMPGQITCPVCKGVKRIQWGWHETNPEVAP